MHKMRHCGNAQKQRFLTPADNTVPWGQKRSGSGSGRNNWLYPIEEREEHRAPNDSLGSHTPPPPAARRGSSAVHPPPLRCAHGSETAPSCAESATHGHARRSGCVLLRGSGQPAPPTCRSRLRSAGCAVCPSRRSRTPAAPSVPRGASHTQPPHWARPAGSLTCAGRGGSSRRRALRYGR